MVKIKFKRLFYRYVLPYTGLFIVKVISSTYRLKIVDAQNESRILENGSLIYASWHQRFFPGITFFARRKPIAIMISPSRDGEYMAHIVNILGWNAVRGSSSRKGKEALDKLKELALAGHKIGHIVDGPKGPFGVVKPGLIRIAQFTGMPIVPTITSAQNKWSFNSWDKFMVPKPFSRVLIRFGEAVHVKADLSEDEFEQKRLLVEKNMKKLYEDTDRFWSDPQKLAEIFA
jgi:lysophospholipid acyltransferase (LPLAT)-like uncharacterized protein